MSARPIAPLTTALVLVTPDRAALDVHVDGSTLLRRCIDSLLASAHVTRTVVAAPAPLLTATQDACAGLPVEVHPLGFGDDPVGDVARRLAGPEVEVLLVHDGARGTVGTALVDAVIAGVRDGAAACAPLIGVTDTVKRVVDGRVLDTVDRSALVSLQTPQAFAVRALRDGRKPDSLLLLDVDGDVRYIHGGPEAQRIPAPEAGVLAEALLRWRQVTEVHESARTART